MRLLAPLPQGAELDVLYDIADEAALVRAIVALLNEDDWGLNTKQWRDLFDRFPPAIEAGVKAYEADVLKMEVNLRGFLASGFMTVEQFRTAINGLISAGLLSAGGREMFVAECTRKEAK